MSFSIIKTHPTFKNFFNIFLRHRKLFLSPVSKFKNNNSKIWAVSKPGGWITVLAFFWPLKKDNAIQEKILKIDPPPRASESQLKEADQFYDNGQYNECLEMLRILHDEFDKDIEVIWRKSRILYQLASNPEINKKLKHELAFEAFDTISYGMLLNENHFAVHKWMSVILDLKTSCEGLKERIKCLETVKKHMLKAVEINPKDATTLYMLGEWCYRITDMPWYQRRIAQTLFANPPTSTYNEAIQYFSQAEVVEPRFYSMNLLMLGKTYLKLGKEDIAKYYLNLALLYPARTNDDHQANKEAQDILKTLT